MAALLAAFDSVVEIAPQASLVSPSWEETPRSVTSGSLPSKQQRSNRLASSQQVPHQRLPLPLFMLPAPPPPEPMGTCWPSL